MEKLILISCAMVSQFDCHLDNADIFFVLNCLFNPFVFSALSV